MLFVENNPEKRDALAKLLNVSEEDIQVWSDNSLTYNGREYDTKSGMGEYVGKEGRYKFYTSGRI